MLYLNALGSAERLPFVPHLTLTNVVFESQSPSQVIIKCFNLTLTNVVFEFRR